MSKFFSHYENLINIIEIVYSNLEICFSVDCGGAKINASISL